MYSSAMCDKLARKSSVPSGRIRVFAMTADPPVAEIKNLHPFGLDLGGKAPCGLSGRCRAHLDARAKSACKSRLTELREELAEAKQFGNEQWALALDQDIDALLGELRRAIGLRGRDRKAASPAERARVNVTRTIKLALEHIGRVHPELETHLAASVKTGTFCRYQPDPHEVVNWRM